jgi:MFS family permease
LAAVEECLVRYIEVKVSSGEPSTAVSVNGSARPSRVFRGWYIVAALLVIMIFGVGGGLYLFGTLLPALLAEFAWTHAQVSGANSLAMLTMGLLGPVMGRLIDRYGAQTLMSVSAAACGLGFAAQALVGVPALNHVTSPLTQLYVCYVVYGAGLAGIGYVPVNTIVSRWFVKRRGLALGIVAVGTGVGGFLTVPTGWLIDGFGWRVATAVIGSTITAIVVPLVILFIRLRPEDVGLVADDDASSTATHGSRGASEILPAGNSATALTSATFWALAVAFGIYTVTVTIVRIFGIAILREKGFSAPDARFIVAAMALWGILGKIVFGALTDRLPARFVATSAFVLEALGTLFLFASGWRVSIAFPIVYGLPMGGISTLQPVLIGKYFGQGSFGTVYGTLMLLLTIGAATGPVVAGGVYDIGGGYWPTLLVCSVASACAAVIIASRGSAAPDADMTAARS